MSDPITNILVPDEQVVEKIYQVETRALKQAVKRNMSRFPKDFMFQLTKLEWS